MSSSREPFDEVTLIFGSRLLSKSSGICLTWLLSEFDRSLAMVTGCRKVAKTGGICYSSSAELALQSYIHATTQKPSVGRDPGRCSRVAGQPTGCSAFTSSERGPIPSPDHGRGRGPFRKVGARHGHHHAFIRARERYRGEPDGRRQTRPTARGVWVRQLHQPQ